MITRKVTWLVAAAICLFVAVPAQAQRYIFDINNARVGATLVDQADPVFPSSGIRRGQEGWVRMSFIITPDGTTTEPIIIDSAGGAAFEQSAREALTKWRFEPPTTELINNTVDVRFENYRGRDAATSNFLRRYRRIMNHVYHEETEEARELVDGAVEVGGWNLYETTMLCMMLGRVHGQEGDSVGKLEHYSRAFNMANRASLDGEDRRELLSKLLPLQVEHAHYAAANQSLSLLKKEIDSGKEIAALAESIARMDEALSGGSPIAAKATISTACNCEEGQPLWTYVPARRTFSFAALSGNVERFEVRCERERLLGAVETDRTWSLPAGWGACRVFVFGDDGASFEFVEHEGGEPDTATARAVVKSGDVLDRRNR